MKARTAGRCRARVLSGALLLGAAGAALAPAGPDALVPFKLLTASAAQTVGIAVVVDFGDGTVTSQCAHVAAGSTDEQALAAVYPVVTNSSGLICDIDNHPTTDTSQCLNTASDGQFYYWSYFQGSSGSWQYANVGPAGSSDDVEGWRFQDPGPDNPTAPAPEAAATYDAICGASTTTAEPPTPPPASTTPSTGPNNPAVTTTTVGGGNRSNGATGGVKPSTKGGVTTTTATGAARTGVAATTKVSTHQSNPSTSTGSGSSRGSGDRHDKNTTALASASVPGSSSGGAPILPIVLVGVVIALLAGLGYYRWRQRPVEE